MFWRKNKNSEEISKLWDTLSEFRCEWIAYKYSRRVRNPFVSPDTKETIKKLREANKHLAIENDILKAMLIKKSDV